tara:strand:+ start:1087 stop:1842 length:756 start_codon:yes stop_codon:yes gene_type:complete
MFGICILSIVPVRKNRDDKSEMISQLLYGDLYEVIEKKDKWLLIKTVFDNYKGWIDNKQFLEIKSEDLFNQLIKNESYSLDLINYVETLNKELIPIILGSNIGVSSHIKHIFDGEFSNKIRTRKDIIETSRLYMNAPYLWGGKTPFGIDCSGLSQMVYKINGYKIPRDAKDQVNLGVNLGFIEESKEGDLAFFDNDEGEITHVGILLKNNYIIHASGQVKIDKIDQTGIYDLKKKKHTHKLRTIKNIIDSN